MMDAMFPAAASAHAGKIDQMIDVVHYLMFAVFIAWGAFFVYVLMRFRARRNPKAHYVGVKSKASTYGEVAVAVVEGGSSARLLDSDLGGAGGPGALRIGLHRGAGRGPAVRLERVVPGRRRRVRGR